MQHRSQPPLRWFPLFFPRSFSLGLRGLTFDPTWCVCTSLPIKRHLSIKHRQLTFDTRLSSAGGRASHSLSSHRLLPRAGPGAEPHEAASLGPPTRTQREGRGRGVGGGPRCSSPSHSSPGGAAPRSPGRSRGAARRAAPRPRGWRRGTLATRPARPRPRPRPAEAATHPSGLPSGPGRWARAA